VLIHSSCLLSLIADSLPGPPLSNDTALVTLIKYSVTVGLGVREAWEARNTRFDLQWVCDSELVSFSYGLAYGV
jgi:hypothetical protein